MEYCSNNYFALEWCIYYTLIVFFQILKSMAGMTVEPILKKQIVEYFYCSNHYTALFFILKYVLMDATSGAGTAYPSRAPEFTPGF